MKKLFGILITSMFVVINSSQLFSQSVQQLDEQYGFRDVKFETPLSSFNGLTEVRKDCYKLKNENLKFGKYELNEVVYRFYKGLLSNVILKVDENNNIGIRLLLINAYGTESDRWTGEKVTLEYMGTSPSEPNQVIIFTCNKLRDLEKSDEIQTEVDRKQMEIKVASDKRQMEGQMEVNSIIQQLYSQSSQKGYLRSIQQLDEKYGFQDAKFEMPFSSFKELTEAPSFAKDCYQVKNENLKLGDYELGKVYYHFYKGLLSSIFLEVNMEGKNNEGMLNILIDAYGEGSWSGSYNSKRSWRGEKVTLTYDNSSNYVAITFKCNKLFDLEEVDIIQTKAKSEADKIQVKAKVEADKKQKEAEAIQPLDEKYGFRDAKFEMPYSSFKALIEVPLEKSYHQNQNKNLKLGDYQSNEVFLKFNKAFNQGTTADLNLRDAITFQALTSLVKIGKPSKNLSDYELNKMAIQSLNKHKVPFEGYYKLKDENLKVGDYELNEVVYRFYKGKLSNIILQMDTKNSGGILHILYNAYGKETQLSDGLRYWLGKKVSMAYRDFRLDLDHIIVVFTCIKLSELEETDRKQAEAKEKTDKKQMEEKAAKDL